MRRELGLVLVCGITLWGCTSDVVPEIVHDGIGAAGGTLRSSDGRIRLEIPPGALASATVIRIREIDNNSLPAGSVLNTGFELLPDGLTFAKPVKLTLAYKAEALPGADATWLRVVQLLDSGGLAMTDPVADGSKEPGTISASLRHFSKYVLADLKLANAAVTTTKKKISDVDVLFVVDNSNSMESKQARLAQNFPRFIQKLEQAQLNYRVGVISTDIGAGPYSFVTCESPGGDGGKLQNKARIPGCTPPKDPWIENNAGLTNVPGGDVASAFSCIARLGVGGCGFEQPLEAAHRALDPALNLNPGFLRPGAALVVVVITDEDDCSAKDPSLFDPAVQGSTSLLGPLNSFRCTEFGITCDVNGRTPGVRQNCKPSTGSYLHDLQRYVSLLSQLKPGGEVVVSIIAGPASPVEVALDGGNAALKPSCQSADGGASPAVRLAALTSTFGKRGAFTSVCDSDYGPALEMVGNLVVEQIQVTWCLPFKPVDTKPATPEIDADCSVVASVAGKLESCKPGDKSPCYHLEESATCGSSKTTISVENLAPAALGDEVYVICLSQP